MPLNGLIRVLSLRILKCLPLTRFFLLKRRLLNLSGVEALDGVRVVSSVKFLNGGKITIAENTWIGHEVMFVGGNAKIEIGSDVDVAPRVTFITGTHTVLHGEHKAAGDGYSEPIYVGSGCWVCAGATILPGTIIGEASIVAAGAVVKGTFPARKIIGGVPARVISDL